MRQPLITDFGFTRLLKANEQAFTMCGTPNYLPPEIIKNDGHTSSADNWSFGVLLYEVVQGENPFFYEGLDQVSLFEAICSESWYPCASCSDDFVDLIQRLLEKNPAKRLGTFREKDILDHSWFADINMQELRMKRINAPWKPGPVVLDLD
ncbi:MAG: serine/threonine protein kinase [Bacillariaceae sp.]